MDVFAKQLREKAANLGITHAEVARRSGLSERRYGHYVSGIREPDLATLVRIAQTLQTTPDALLGVGETPVATSRTKLMLRLIASAQALPDEILEIIVIQSEALATRQTGKV